MIIHVCVLRSLYPPLYLPLAYTYPSQPIISPKCAGSLSDHACLCNAQALPPRDLSSLLSVLRGGGAKGSSDNTSTQAVEILLDDISRTSRALAESGNVQQLRLLLQEIQQGM